MTKPKLISTFPLSAFDKRGELACLLALKETQIHLFYSAEDCALFVSAPSEECSEDLSEYKSREEKSLLKPKTTYSLNAIKALTHPILGVLSNLGLRGETKFWAQEIDLKKVAQESLAEGENDIVFAFDFFKGELFIYEKHESFLERQLKQAPERFLANQI